MEPRIQKSFKIKNSINQKPLKLKSARPQIETHNPLKKFKPTQKPTPQKLKQREIDTKEDEGDATNSKHGREATDHIGPPHFPQPNRFQTPNTTEVTGTKAHMGGCNIEQKAITFLPQSFHLYEDTMMFDNIKLSPLQ